MQYTETRVDTDIQQFPAPGGSPAALNRVAPSDPAKGSGQPSGRKQSEATKAKIRAKAFERYEWDDAKIARVIAMVEAGASARDIARKEHVYRGTLAKFCIERGLQRRTRRPHTQDGDNVLIEHYATEPDLDRLLTLYRAARGFEATYEAMRQNAAQLGLHRPRVFPNTNQKHSRDKMAAQYAAARAAIAPQLQALLDTGMGLERAAKQMGISLQRANRMKADGLVTKPAQEPKAPRVKAQAAPKAKKADKPFRPQFRPASWVRSDAAPKPKPVYESVEAWLAAGNQIKRCPTVAVEATTAKIPEADRAALTALYAERERNKVTGRNGAALRAASLARGRAHGWLT